MRLPPNLNKAVKAFAKLPGIGQKTAFRLVFYLLSQHKELAHELASSLEAACAAIQLCSICCNFTESDPCPICDDPDRDQSTICVVETPADVIALERTNEYHGLYHVLHGAISPVQGITANDIHLRELFSRLLQASQVKEIILANNATAEGEATALYIAQLLKPTGIKLSQMAKGLPVGANLEYADELTLTKAIEGRQQL